MNIKQKVYKRLTDFPELYQETMLYLDDQPRFSIFTTNGLFYLRRRNICKKILNPLIPSIESIIFYELKSERKEVKKYKSNFKLNNGRHIFDLNGKRWEYYMPLLYKPRLFSTIHDIRGSILIKCQNENIPWENIFQHCFGPFQINNPSVGCGRAALNYTKKYLNENHIFIIINKINSGLECFTIICDRILLKSIYEIAANTCVYK